MSFGQILIALNLIGGGLLIWQGSTEDRIGVALITAATIAELTLYDLRIGTWPWAVALANAVFFVGFWWLAEHYDRWWQFLTACIQFLIAASHFAALTDASFSFWTIATIQLGLWALVSIILFGGAWEAWADRRYRLERASWDNNSPSRKPSKPG